MSALEPVTAVEAAALAAAGLDPTLLAPRHCQRVMGYYRAGFVDGRQPPALRVFRPGDPEPGPEVQAVLDVEGDTWGRYDHGWGLSPAGCTPWSDVIGSYGPVVAGLPPWPSYWDVIEADAKRRAGAESTGGVR